MERTRSLGAAGGRWPFRGAEALAWTLVLVLAALLLVEAAHRQARAVTAPAPAMFGIEREQARVELGKAPGA